MDRSNGRHARPAGRRRHGCVSGADDTRRARRGRRVEKAFGYQRAVALASLHRCS